MADVLKENLTDNATNGTAKTPPTPEGVALAYASLVLMALLPIFFGSLRSVKHRNKQLAEEQGKKKDSHAYKGDTPMSHKDAAMFPFVASAALLSLYSIFQIFSKEYINLLLTFYFFCLGVVALCHLVSPVVSKLVPAAIPNIPYHIRFTQGGPNDLQDIINYRFSSHDIVCIIFCSLIGAWYLMKKHWIANNLFGIAFAINGVELLHLNNVVTGCILLCGLFVYDIFWVFGTNVMVTVAKSFEAPIKLVFPHDLLEKGLGANNFAMLGLGDIVIPGIFIALLLRFDNSLKRNSKTYFYATFIAYILGLMATICVMHVFKHAQPALLYLVPACLGTPFILAIIKGDLRAMLKYEESSKSKAETQSEETKKEKKKKK
ncbi:UNVERIFIED_CONTAM: hypothetical protein PYX00_001140 [Menopon gallinae]|uniref:Minor histocompatibility antigen H13 n=1 Tax=Menopon gallinae TaxID=328185 RepID=A0AAW2ICZ3_9NEOP